MTIQKNNKPWFKQFWPWFLILLPTCGVVASMATITLAVGNAPVITTTNIGKFAREESISEEVQR